MIKVVGYFGDRGACRAYRLLYPFSRIGKHHKDKFQMHLAGYIKNEQVGKFDVAVLQRQYDPEVFRGVQIMKQNGTKLIYEIDDDLFTIPKWNPAHAELSSGRVQRGVKAFLSICDAVFVTTETLANVYRKYCKNVHVLPNSLDFDRFVPKPGVSSKKCILWQGSGTHERDLQILGGCLEQVHARQDSFVRVWGGHKLDGTYHVNPVSFESFYTMLAQMDAHIGLAPLVPCAFNNSKSNLKFLEYSAQNMVTIASNVGPYADTIVHGETGLLVGDNNTWYDVICSVLNDENLYNRLQKNAYEFVHDKFDIEKNYHLWIEAIESVL